MTSIKNLVEDLELQTKSLEDLVDEMQSFWQKIQSKSHLDNNELHELNKINRKFDDITLKE